MIQDIFPKKLNNSFKDIKPADNDYLLFFNDGKLFLSFDADTGLINFPLMGEFRKLKTGEADEIYLFSIDEDKYFFKPDFLADGKVLSGGSYYTLREIRDFKSRSDDRVFAAFTAYHLCKWYTDNHYCGRCGSGLAPDKGSFSGERHIAPERALVCAKCGNKIYPRINPAVIIGVTDKKNNKLILTKYRTGFGHNALVAGFTEIGETLEETVAREVMEEVGLKITNVRYYKSQPWGIASDILAGFFCDVEGDTTIHMDKTELKYAEWVAPEDVVLQPMEYSLTNEMMKLFKENGYEGTVNY